jgi:hypothetical protein
MALTSLLVGLLLIAVNVFGRMRGAVPVAMPTGRAPVAGYDYRKLPTRVARVRFRALKRSRLSDLEKLSALFRLVSGSVVHRKYRLDLFDNWLVAGAALIYPEMRNTQDARLLWARGAGKCDQASLLLLAKARELGIEGRILGLDGHVLVETRCGGEAQVLDADMGCIWRCSYEQLREQEKSELKAEYERQGFTTEQAVHNARIITGSTDWNRFDFPPARLRYRFERLAVWLTWVLPAIAIMYGASQ